MAVKKEGTRTAELKRLFEERERLEREYPELRPSFQQFLKEFSEYEVMRQSLNRRSNIEDYLLYGARYEESE